MQNNPQSHPQERGRTRLDALEARVIELGNDTGSLVTIDEFDILFDAFMQLLPLAQACRDAQPWLEFVMADEKARYGVEANLHVAHDILSSLAPLLAEQPIEAGDDGVGDSD